MAELHRKPTVISEHSKDNQNAIMGDEEGVDGEIDEIEEVDTSGGVTGKPSYSELLSPTIRDVGAKDSTRKHGSERRRHHRHHHSSGHRDRRRRSGGQGDPEAEQYVSEEDGRVSSGRTKLRSESANHSNFESDKNSRFSHRKNDRHSGHTRVHLEQPWSKQNMEDTLENGELSDSREDPLAQTRHANTPKRMTKDKKEHQSPLTGGTEAGEAEDGEILEDGELSDDETVASKDGESISRDVVEVSSAKLTSKEDGKSERHRKRSEHKSKRKRDSDEKTRRKKYADDVKMEAENTPAPAWGSGYQGPKPKTSPFHNKSQGGKGGRGYHSPPGLYDSPSYSEDSGEESLPKSLMTEGYIDASVAADEKEGIFNPKINFGKRKRFPLERNDRKRGRNFDGKSEGPPRKKLLSQAMSDRPVCKFYMEGKCAKGSNCQFNHDAEKPARKMEVCKYHLTVKGCIKQRCLYMHEDYPCKYYHTGAKCYSGDRCKFSHDPLTEDTKRALEMRVAAEDIIDVEEMDYDYDYRSRESHSSPPRFRQDVKKIPSLFEIEVHPPGQSPKPSPQAASRPSGFYNETTASPKPGVGPSAGASGPGNNPNIGVMNNSAPANQPGLPNQGNMGGPGLLQTPLRPGNLIGGPMGNNRPNLIMGMNPQQQRPGGVAPIQFMGPRSMNSNQQGANLPPVLNMLGAIIREAAMQKGPAGPNSNINMGPNSGMVPILQNMQNLGQGLNMLNSNNIQQGNMNVGPNNMGNVMLPNNKGNMQPGNTNNMGPLPNMMGPNSNNGNMGPNNIMGNANTNDNIGPNDGLGQSASINNVTGGRNNIGQEVGNMDVDYRIKPDLIEIEETNKELSELDKIRQQLQAQIDKEEEDEGPEENEGKVQNSDDLCNTDEEKLVPVVPDSVQETDDVKDDKAAVKTDAADVEQIEFPADLPKTQRELFKRIQQQQIIREKERKKQEALKVTEESGTKAEDDDWYSSDDDEGEEDKPNLTDILKKLNQPSPAPTVETAPSVPDSLNTSSSAPSTTSTFNIIQMINAIKNQTATKPTADSAEASPSCKLSPPQSNQQKEVFLSSPASPPPVSTSISSLHLPQLTVDPPVVSAQPTKPLVYSVVKISLIIAKPYSQLPDSVHATDQTFRDDPRVKWHLNYLEKLQSKIPQKKEMSDGEKSQKQTDPRLKKGPSDPRLNKPSEGPNSSKVSDPRLQRAAVQSRPADPRLARQMVGNLDPRLSRQNSQNSADGIFLSGAMNSMGGGPMNAMGPGPMNAMGPGPMNAMGPGPMNAMGGVMNSHMGSSGNGMGVLMSSPAGSGNHIGGSMNNLLHNIGPVVNAENQLNVVNPMNSPMGGPGRPFPGGGGPLSNAMGVIGGPVNMAGPVNQNGGPFNPAGPGTNQMIRMGGPHGPGGSLVGIGGGNTIDSQMGNIRGPLSQQNPVGNDPGLLDPRINNPSGARPGNQRPVIDPLSVNDPRLKNRLMDPREQRMFAKDPRSAFRDTQVVASSPSGDGVSDPGINHANSDYKNISRVPVDIRQSPNYSQSGLPSFGNSEHLKVLQDREEFTHSSDPRIEHNEHLQLASALSSTQYSDVDKPTRKFDHRNDPRFKRVKRLPGQTKSNMEYNSPLSSEDSPGDVNDGGGPDYNGYFHSRVNPSRDPRSRGAASPTLPDTLQDFDLPNSSAVIVVESELNLKVKDHFKTIDPTASPFC